MNILRLSTLSLALAITAFVLGYVDPASAAPKKCILTPDAKGCGEEPGDGLIYTVDLRGNANTANPIDPYGDQGAFEFDMAGQSSPASAILDKGDLKGTELVTMTRPGDLSADVVWNDVFNLCGLLGPPSSDPDDGAGPTHVDTFDVEGGDWSVSKGGGKIWLSLGFTILAIDNPATTRDLSVSLQLTGPCNDPVNFPSCEDTPLIPMAPGSIDTKLTNSSIHLRGRGGVTHQAVCHADNDDALEDNARDSGSTLVITATATPP